MKQKYGKQSSDPARVPLAMRLRTTRKEETRGSLLFPEAAVKTGLCFCFYDCGTEQSVAPLVFCSNNVYTGNIFDYE